MCENLCEDMGKRISRLRASEKELRDELRNVTARCNLYEAALLRIAKHARENDMVPMCNWFRRVAEETVDPNSGITGVVRKGESI